jgi:cytochrome oxidase assembly protein ShyY1
MRRRVLTMLVAVCVAAVCVVAGIWQWGRHAERSATAALVEANYDAAPVPVAQVLTPALADDDVWRRAVVVGRYVDSPVLLRGRPVDGSPAVHELGVVEIAEGDLAGSFLVVNRGWLALTPDAGLPALPARPDGVVELVVRLRPLESSGREADAGQVYRIAAADLTRAGVDHDVLPAYGVVADEDDDPPVGLAAQPRPEVSIGVNLSYAFQWWLFAAGSLFGGVLLVRQPDTPAPVSPRPTSAARRRRPSAEDEEDAIVDAQEAATTPAPPLRGADS